MMEFLSADIRRLTDQEQSVGSKIGVLCFSLGLHAVLLYRCSRWLCLHHLTLPAVLITYLNSILTGAQISHRATVGKGFAIYHPQGTVVGGTAVIGDFCTLVHGNVIGQGSGGDDRPVIGHHFYAGSGAKIIGKIHIGDNVRVMANSVVLHSLGDGVTAAGIPARVILARETDHRPANGRDLSDREILDRLVAVLRRTVNVPMEVESIDEFTGLLGEGIGLDSIEMLKLICAMEEEFDLTLDESALGVSHFKTVGSVLRLIRERSVA